MCLGKGFATAEDVKEYPYRCDVCNGKGCYQVDWHCYKCKSCNGTGKKPLTNEQWLKGASTEELAWLLYEIAVYDTLNDRIRNAEVVEPSTDGTSGFEEVIRWLKEKHNA